MKLKRVEIIIVLALILMLIVFVILALSHSIFNLISIFTGKVTSENTNLIPNPDFEIDTLYQKTLPQYWVKNSEVSGDYVTYNIEEGSFGNFASIKITQPVNQWIGMKTEAIAVEPNTQYKLSGLLYCDNCSSPNDLILTLHVIPKENAQSNFYYKVNSSNIFPRYAAGYDKTELIFTTDNNVGLSAYVIISFWPGKTGTGYIDNLLFEQISGLEETAEEIETSEEETSDEEIEESEDNLPTGEETIEETSEEITELSQFNVNIKTFDYLKNEQEMSVASKIAGTSNIKENSLVSEKHPIVLYTDINIIKDRIKREPYSSWWEDIKETEWVVNYDISKFKKLEKAKYAKIMAFIYAVTEEEKYGDAARNLLININSGSYSENEEVEGLIWSSEAYDILKGAEYNFEREKISTCSSKNCNCKISKNIFSYGKKKCSSCDGCEDLIRNRLKEQMKSLAETSIDEIASNDLVRKNNLNIRRYSAVGTAALVLHNKEFFDNSIQGGATLGSVGKIADNLVNLFTSGGGFKYKGVGDTINHQIVDYSEGGWAEGPYYMRYSFLAAIPFMKAMENAGVENNWLDTTSLKNLFEWGIKIRMPNGARPPFDDSNIDSSYFFNGYLESPLYNWDWVNSEKEYYSNDWGAVTEIDNICYYNDKIGQEEPEWSPTQILPTAGQIIFRSGWNSDDIYLAFLGENGKAVSRGYGHEHSDAMSFIIYAYGEYLAIDPGYIKWNEREKTSNSKNHNVVLVNEEIQTQSYIDEKSFFSTENLDYGKISDDSGHERGILFIDKSYFLVFDVLNSYSQNNYEFLVHGNGLISDGTAREYSMSAGEWKQNGVSLLSYVLPKQKDTVTFNTGINSESYGKSSEHTYMSIKRTGKNIGFLSLLYPSETGEYPTISKTTSKGVDIMNIQGGDWNALSFVNENRITLDISEHGLQTNAEKLFVKRDVSNNIEYLFADDVTILSLNGEKLFESSSPTTVSIILKEDSIKVYYNDNGNINLYKKTENLLYNGQNKIDQLYFDGVISL